MVLLNLVLCALNASAQNLDAHGPPLPPDGASVRDPVTGFGGVRPVNATVQIWTEGAVGVLVEEVVEDDDLVQINPLVDQLFGVNLGGMVGINSRIALGISAPVWLVATGEQSGPAFGDTHLWLPIRLVRQEHARVGVVPFARLPTGNSSRFLGDPFGGGALLSAGVDYKSISLHGDLGLEVTGPTGVDEWPGGVLPIFSADLALSPIETAAVHLEARSRTPIQATPASFPSELLLMGKGAISDRVWVTGGLGFAMTRGIGAAGPRVVLGLSASLGGETAEPAANPPEATLDVLLFDPAHQRIESGMVMVDGQAFPTDREGFARIPLKLLKRGNIVVSHPLYITKDIETAPDDVPWWEITLERRRVRVSVSVVGPEGILDLADVKLLDATSGGAQSPPDAKVNLTGVHRWELLPGTRWVASVSAEGMGGQARVIDIKPERTEPIRIDVQLDYEQDPSTKLTVVVVDRLGDPVEDAVVGIGPRDFGTTGPGGELEIRGLPREEVALTVRSAHFGERRVVSANVEDDTRVEAVLDWPAGGVIINASNAEGQPLDATVRFLGPESLPERRIGTDGEMLAVLRPGEWNVLVTADGYSRQERWVTPDVEATEPKVLRFVLQQKPNASTPSANLILTTVDASGDLVPGVDINVDGRPLGTTDERGELRVAEVEPGELTIETRGKHLSTATTSVTVQDADQRILLPVQPAQGTIEMLTTNNGQPVAATVTVSGDVNLPPMALGSDGQLKTVLQPGDYTLRFEADGMEPKEVVLADSSQTPQVVVAMAKKGSPGASLLLDVDIPSNTDIQPATIAIDGQTVGVSSGGKVTLTGLEPGQHTVQVQAMGAKTINKAIDIQQRTEVAVALEPADKNTLSIFVQGPDGPVEATAVIATHDKVRQVVIDQQRSVEVQPGQTYSVVVRAAGLATKTMEVVATDSDQDLVVRLEEAKAKTTVIRLEDLDGKPVGGAIATQNGKEVGRSDTTGNLPLTAKVGELVITPNEAERLRPVRIQTPKDGQTLVLADGTRPIVVTVAYPDGRPFEGEVKAFGSDKQTSPTVNGKATLQLLPGPHALSVVSGQFVGHTNVLIDRRHKSAQTATIIVEEIRANKADTDGVSHRSVMLSEPILFDLGKYDLRPEGQANLEDLARLLQADRSIALVEIAGHTDDIGGATYNQELSENRAATVKEALVAFGVAPERLVRRGYGLSRPASSRTDPEGRQLNRRVEIVILQSTTD